MGKKIDNKHRKHIGDTNGDGANLPYPETDFSPALQRTLKRKFESGEMESVDRDEFFRTLGRTVKDESCDEEQ